MQARLAEKILKTIYLWRRMLTVLLGFLVVVGGVGGILLIASLRSDASDTTSEHIEEAVEIGLAGQQSELKDAPTIARGRLEAEEKTPASVYSSEKPKLQPSEKREAREITENSEAVVEPVARVSEAAQTSPSNTTYTVQRGDTLWAIAQARLGSGYRYLDLARWNQLSNPSHIEVGQVLSLDAAIEQVLPGQITEIAASIDLDEGERAYSVEVGDSLWMIASTELGDPYLWPTLYERNREVIGDNPDLIYPTVTLVLPHVPPPFSSVDSSGN